MFCSKQNKYKNLKVLIIFIILILSFIVLTACSNNGSSNKKPDNKFFIVDSNISDGQTVSTDLKEIIINFNKEVGQIKQVELYDLSENKNSISHEHKIDGKRIIVSNFIIFPIHQYQLVFGVEDNDSKYVGGNIKFIVDRTSYPEPTNPNQTMMQAFYWEMNEGEYAHEHPEEADLWNLLAQRAPELAEMGITSLWLPPASKGNSGGYSVGYDVYDLWDLGEFNQKDTERTKYGSKDKLERTIASLHSEGIKVYFDAVLNHRMGADDTDYVPLEDGGNMTAWTEFQFSGRNGEYSDFTWDWECFDGVDGKLFKSKSWDWTVEWDQDYLMGNDVDYENPDVEADVTEWGKWIVEEIDFDGFRLDAVKHIDYRFLNRWINTLENFSDKDLFFVGEYIGSIDNLKDYINEFDDSSNIKVFDYPLRGAFESIRDGQMNMAQMGSTGTGLVNEPGYEGNAVTFIDNHDTDRDSGTDFVSIWLRKYQAYTYILTREEGLPTVYWKDYYHWGMKEGIDKILKARKHFAYGPGHEMGEDTGNESNTADVYSYVREGLDGPGGDGLVMMISDGSSGEVVSRKINSYQPNTEFYDLTSNIAEHITTDKSGYGIFKVRKAEDTGWSIWVPVE